MRFYDRERELAKLSEIASLSRDSSHLVVITGRRRVGKTELIRRFAAEGEEALYFFVSRKKPQILLEEFRDLVAVRYPLLKRATFSGFDDFFRFLFDVMKERPLFVVFDEFRTSFMSIRPYFPRCRICGTGRRTPSRVRSSASGRSGPSCGTSSRAGRSRCSAGRRHGSTSNRSHRTRWGRSFPITASPRRGLSPFSSPFSP